MTKGGDEGGYGVSHRFADQEAIIFEFVGMRDCISISIRKLCAHL